MDGLRHGSAVAYNQGCRCGECRSAHRERARAYRAGKRTPGATGATVTALPSLQPVPEAESVVDAVRRDLQGLRPGPGQATAVATALALARVLDDPHAVPQRAAAAAQLTRVMDVLRQRRTPRRDLTGGLG